MSDFSCGTNPRPCTAFPRILGVLMALGWLTFLSPPLGAKYLYPYGHRGRIATLWLLVMGVNAEAWKEQAAAKGE